MQIRALGSTPFMVGRIALGCVTFGREIDEAAAFELMDYAVEQGINLFDTAEAYGEGASERIVGRWLRARGCRDRIVLQTKVTTDFSMAHVREALARSLDRLQCEQVDVYLMHSYDAGRPIEESLEAMTWSVDAGKAQTIGGSNFTMEQLRAALAASLARNLAPLRVLQPVYNLVAREAEQSLFPLCAEHGIGITSYSPLGAGFLTGKYTGDRSAMPAGSRFAIKPAHADLYFHPANFEVLAQLRRLAEASGHSLATLAMAWVLRQPAIDSVLTGARDKSHLDNALHCMRHLTELAAVWEDAAHRFA
ncbi:MAG: aldo/keto reductase [bacterium]|jgi:aryl-alcohol dehydrogenase-like predicted oxidoreductase